MGDFSPYYRLKIETPRNFSVQTTDKKHPVTFLLRNYLSVTSRRSALGARKKVGEYES